MLFHSQRAKGESREAHNKRAHESYKQQWTEQKKASGTWVSKEQYEKQTGKPGKK